MPPSPTTQAPSFLSADGTKVAVERVYEGDCAPAGSRGGCHTITLRPDGTHRNFLFDAAIEGTYTIANGTVKLTGSDPSMTEELPLSADGTMLGTLALKRVGPE
jgi:hypothetical protein